MINLAISILIGFTSPLVVYHLTENKIYWKPDYKLQYSDFKKKNIKKSKIPIGEITLKASYVLEEETGKLPVYTVFNIFDAEQSWMNINNENLLNEYQFIWNLHELYIRKARKEIKDLYAKKCKDNKLYEEALRKNIRKFEKERKRYDGVLQNQPSFY